MPAPPHNVLGFLALTSPGYMAKIGELPGISEQVPKPDSADTRERPQFSVVPQLRVAVNARCQRACFYCRPSGEGPVTQAKERLDAKTVYDVVAACAKFGVKVIKLTGGDPALWVPLVECVHRIKSDLDVDLEIITEHPKIADYVDELADAGIDSIKVSVDTLKPDLHKKISGVADLEGILEAVRKCVASGVPTKLNMVVMKGINDQEIGALVDFCEREGIKSLKLLDLMTDLHDGDESFASRLRAFGVKSLSDIYFPLSEVVDLLRSRAVREDKDRPVQLGNPVINFTMPSGLVVSVKDHQEGAWYGSICEGCQHFPCNSAIVALRLTAGKRLQYCLLRDDLCVDLEPTLDDPVALEGTLSKVLGVYDKAYFSTFKS